MKDNQFQILQPVIDENTNLRVPQREAYATIAKVFTAEPTRQEIGIVLPVGCGKSGCITLTPFAVKSVRALVVAPNLNIAQQLADDFNPTKTEMFYQKCKVLNTSTFPEYAEIRGSDSNISDLENADVVVTNIQQLQGMTNQWLAQLSNDFFDLILFDEAHHNVASTWENLRTKFPKARIVNFSATPLRADGKKMSGEIVYSFPVARAIKEGYVKKLKAVVLNPQTLKYVRNEDGQEIEVSLDEVIRLGEEEAGFRRSIVTSKETLDTIVNASIQELDRIRKVTQDDKHKIIASALNYDHCIQIVSAYRARGRRAEYVHSKEGKANDRVYKLLENNDLDVIVQVRKLGEGFDHKYLSVAAVFSIFANLSPFVQFVGRIMRVIEQNNPDSLLNQGTVIFHAGSNMAKQWSDFQTFSEADQDYFNELLPIEELDFSSGNEIEISPRPWTGNAENIVIKGQNSVAMQEIPLIDDDPEAKKAIEYLLSKGYTPKQVTQEMVRPVPTTKQNIRRASRTELDAKIKIEVGKILGENHINPEGKDLDKAHLGKTNFVVIKSAIDKSINQFAGRGEKERSEFSQEQYDKINAEFSNIVTSVVRSMIGGKA